MIVFDNFKEWLVYQAEGRLFTFSQNGYLMYGKIESAVFLGQNDGWLLGVREYYEGVAPANTVEYLSLNAVKISETPEEAEECSL